MSNWTKLTLEATGKTLLVDAANITAVEEIPGNAASGCNVVLKSGIEYGVTESFEHVAMVVGAGKLVRTETT